MDEIFIEEKRYISSKQAAKLTGYAKDYIGQLCREGRVPARLIGRSWYVLETAIQDHRFGNTEETETEKAVEKKSKAILPPTWETPHYETTPKEVPLSIKPLKTESDVSPQNIQDSWSAWFNRFDENAGTSEGMANSKKVSDEGIKEENEEKEEEKAQEIPIHTIYKPLPAELLPHHSAIQLKNEREEEAEERQHNRKITKKWSRTTMIAVQMVGILLAVITAVTAIIGSGYFDKYILSSSQASFIAGVLFYNK